MKTLNLILIFIAFSTTILLYSCGRGDSESNPFIAKWKVAKEDGTNGHVNEGSFYNFQNDTNVTISLGIIKSECTYKISNDTLFIHFPSDITVVHTFKMNGDKLILSNITTDQILTLEKQ